MSRVDVEYSRPETKEVLARAAQQIVAQINIAIGSVDLSSDHPVFEPVHTVVRRHLGATPYTVRVRLASESNKQYALTLSDIPQSLVAP